jgi:hypothetical protein
MRGSCASQRKATLAGKGASELCGTAAHLEMRKLRLEKALEHGVCAAWGGSGGLAGERDVAPARVALQHGAPVSEWRRRLVNVGTRAGEHGGGGGEGGSSQPGRVGEAVKPGGLRRQTS